MFLFRLFLAIPVQFGQINAIFVGKDSPDTKALIYEIGHIEQELAPRLAQNIVKNGT